MALRIGLLGYSGRMGQAILASIAANPACTLAGGVVHTMKPEYEKSEVLITTDAEKVIKACDVVIDFTAADATLGYAKLAALDKKPFVSGTTGLKTDAIEALKQVSKTIPLLYAPNTSLSLAAMKQLTALAAKLLGPFHYDVAILDEHHSMKKDAPSGTALALGDAVTKANGGVKTPSYSAIRAGAIIGNHEVAFVGKGEIIRLQHSVTDRAIFANGAVDAVLWLHNKPAGFYSMDDVLGIKPAV